MIRSLATEQTEVDMSQFALAPAPPQLEKLKSIGRRAIIYTTVPVLALLGVGCANSTGGTNSPDQNSAVAAVSNSILRETEVPKKNVIPKFKVHHLLWEQLGVTESNPDKRDEVLNGIFSKIYKVQIHAMNTQFAEKSVKETRVIVWGPYGANGYASITIINGVEWVFVPNGDDLSTGVWMPVPTGATIDGYDEEFPGNADVNQIGRTIFFVPRYTINGQPVIFR